MYPHGCIVCPPDIRSTPANMWMSGRYPHDSSCVFGFNRKKHSFQISDLLHLQTSGIPLIQDYRPSVPISLCQQSALGPLKAFCTTKRVQSFVSSDSGSPDPQRNRNNANDKELKFGISSILSEDFGKKQNEKENPQRSTSTVGCSSCSCGAGSPYSGYINSRVTFPSPALNAVHALQPPHYSQSASVDALPGPYSILNDDATGCGQSKRKRSWSRAVFSNLQRKGLEKRFEVQKYVTKPDRRQLAAMLGLTDAQVKVWFQNRRMKWRHAQQQKEKERETKLSSAEESKQNEICRHDDIPELHSPESSDDEREEDIEVDIDGTINSPHVCPEET